ncbi:TPA: hypothetical protein ACSP2U_000621 [Aeromonas veronii]
MSEFVVYGCAENDNVPNKMSLKPLALKIFMKRSYVHDFIWFCFYFYDAKQRGGVDGIKRNKYERKRVGAVRVAL